MRKSERLLAYTLESVGILLVTAGIVVEVVTRADVGYALITSGALLVAAGGFVWAKVVKR